MSTDPSPVSFAALVAPRLCDLQPTIAPKHRARPRFCAACKQSIPSPYACPLDQYRAANPEEARS